MNTIKEIVRDIPMHWVGDGFPVRSLFSYSGGNLYDPFLLLDYAGPHRFEPGRSKRGVGEHPHRGFETVTIVYQGELDHRDSGGGFGSIGPGDVQWMTAASGVVHEEFHSPGFTAKGGTLEMIQLWVNLPARSKMSAPKYQDLRDSDIPCVDLSDSGASVRVIAGEFSGVRGPAETFTPINVWDVQLRAGGGFPCTLPSGHNCLLIAQSGDLSVNGQPLSPVAMVSFEPEAGEIEIAAKTEARCLVLTGEPIGEPVIGQGPFVMNTSDEIRQAILDYQSGKMGALT